MAGDGTSVTSLQFPHRHRMMPTAPTDANPLLVMLATRIFPQVECAVGSWRKHCRCTQPAAITATLRTCGQVTMDWTSPDRNQGGRCGTNPYLYMAFFSETQSRRSLGLRGGGGVAGTASQGCRRGHPRLDGFSSPWRLRFQKPTPRADRGCPGMFMGRTT